MVRAAVVAAVVALLPAVVGAADRYWVGATSASAAADANWSSDPDVVVETTAPQVGDAVHVGALAENRPMTWDLDDVTLASWTQTAEYRGKVTFQTGISRTANNVAKVAHGVLASDGVTRVLKVTGDVTVNGGTWTHSANPSMVPADEGWADGKGVWRLLAEIGGNYTLGAGATNDVTGCGFIAKQGPGFSSRSVIGPSHGGLGARTSHSFSSEYNTAQGNDCYGSVKRPSTLGSGTDSNQSTTCGGGAVMIDVAGDATLAGVTRANGQGANRTGTGWGAGAGGTVFVRARTLRQTGVVSADGGYAGNCGPGGGGRVALVVTGSGSDFANVDRTAVTAAGGETSTSLYFSSCPGSVYFEKPADAGRGELLVRGHGKFSGYGYGMQITGSEEASDTDFSRVTLENRATVCVSPGAVLRTDELVTDVGTNPNALYLAGGTLDFTGAKFCNSNLLFTAALKDATKAGVIQCASTVTVHGASGTFCPAAGKLTILDSPIVVRGNVDVQLDATVTHTPVSDFMSWPYASATGRVDLTVTGDMTVHSGGAVSANKCGFAANSGPGKPPTGGLQVGASHGGEGVYDRTKGSGSDRYSASGAPCYGSLYEPVTLGSGCSHSNCGNGGGAVRLRVAGTLSVAGAVSARGGDGTSSGEYGARTAAGGSVWITAGSLTGGGQIDAGGGTTYGPYWASGGGGRIAVTLTDANATFDAFRSAGGTILARGGKYAGAGTVYLRLPGQGLKEGTLVIDNGEDVAQYGKTMLNGPVVGDEVGSVVLTNAGTLFVGDRDLAVTRDWSAYGKAMVTNDADHAVVFAGAGDSCITGTNRFGNISCTTPGKTLKFGTAGSLFSVLRGGRFLVCGEAGDEVRLRSVADGAQWPMNFGDGALADIEHADVRDSLNDGVLVVATKSTDSGNNVGWNIVGELLPGTNVWTGTKGTDWATADNWSLMRAPIEGDAVVVNLPDSGTCPTLVNDATVADVTVGAGATLSVAGTLNLTGALTVRGALSGSGMVRLAGGTADLTSGQVNLSTGTLRVEASSAVTLDLASDAFVDTVELMPNGNSVRLPNGVTATKLVANGGGAIVLGEGTLADVSDLIVDGFTSGALGLSAGGAAWRLNVRRIALVNGVTVSGSDASGGRHVFATASQAGSGAANTGWSFMGAQVVWTEGEPATGATDVLIVPAGANVSASGAVQAQMLVINGGSARFAAPLGISGDVEVHSGSTLTLDAATSVGGDFLLHDGATLTHSPNGSEAQYRIALQVGGDMTVDPGAKIDLYGRGYAAQCGPGAGFGDGSGGIGGTHGGRASNAKHTDKIPACYGSIRHPITLGSGAGNKNGTASGGGAAELTVAGTLTFNGVLDAEGTLATGDNSHNGQYSPAGGSACVTCARLVGSGTFNVNGARSRTSNPWGGAGGRFALWQTEAADTNAFTGTITAYGMMRDQGAGTQNSLPKASSGTIFIHNAGDAPDGGLLILDDKGGSHTETGDYASGPACCDFPGEDGAVFENARIVVRRGGGLNLTENVKVADVVLESEGAQSRIILNGKQLMILSRRRRIGRGWQGEVTDGSAPGGRVVWCVGLMLMVR